MVFIRKSSKNGPTFQVRELLLFAQIYIYIHIYIYYSWNKVIFHGSVGVARPIPHDWGLFFWIIPLNVLLIGNDMVTNRGYMVITW